MTLCSFLTNEIFSSIWRAATKSETFFSCLGNDNRIPSLTLVRRKLKNRPKHTMDDDSKVVFELDNPYQLTMIIPQNRL